jgi:hypothetical protein
MSKRHRFDPLASSVDLKKLLDSIYFAEEDVATANLDQPTLMLAVARYRIQCMRERMRCDSALKLISSQEAYRYRKKTTINGKALTESGIKEKTGMNKYVHRAQRELDEALVNEELAKQLFEVFKQRAVAINNIIKANSNAIAKELWQLEKGASHAKLRDAAKLVRGKYSKKHEDEEEEG